MRTWDILVPTFYARTPLFTQLLDQLEAQIEPGVRVIAARDQRDPARMAEKQQRLLEASDADYVSLCADDAKLHPEYVSLIHGAMEFDPDVIGFEMARWYPGGKIDLPQAHSIAFHGIPKLSWPGQPDLFWGDRWCDLGGWMPLKRSIGIQARYEPGPSGDFDATWTRAVWATGLLRTEIYFNEILVMPQQLDQGFHGEWESVEPTPNPERSFVKYI